MRTREEILADGKVRELLILEVLLDIREAIKPEPPAPLYVKSPKKTK